MKEKLWKFSFPLSLKAGSPPAIIWLVFYSAYDIEFVFDTTYQKKGSE